LNLQLSG